MSRDISHDIGAMERLLSAIVESADKLGGFDDGPDVRESLQRDVRTLMDLSQTVKRALFAQRERGDTAADSHEARFNALRERMQAQLPQVLRRLQESSQGCDAPPPRGDIVSQPLLDQEQLDGETEYLQVLEQEINSILTAMQELNRIFKQTLDELQKQRHILVGVDSMVSSSTGNMQDGNKDLDKAADHQRGTTKCLFIIILIVAIAAVGIVVFCVLITRKKK